MRYSVLLNSSLACGGAKVIGFLLICPFLSVLAEDSMITDSVSNLMAFARGEFNGSRGVFGVEGKFYKEDGYQPSEPLWFEAGFQRDTFYARKLWRIENHKLVSTTNGTIYGAAGDTKWIVRGDTKYVSATTNSAVVQSDPVIREVNIYRSRVSVPLRMGFPPGMRPFLSGKQILIRQDADKEITANMVTDKEGRVAQIRFPLTNAVLEASISIQYQYDEGPQRPKWMPSVIRVDVEETLKKIGKRISYSDTNWVRSCTIGANDPPLGYSPEMFLPNGRAERTLVWTNGRGVQSEGSNSFPILPSDTPSAAGLKLSRWSRYVLLGAFLAVSAFFLRLIRNQSRARESQS